MRESGFFGLSIEAAYGGQGLNLHEYLKVVEEMVKLDISIAITFLAHLSIGIKAVQLFGNKTKGIPPGGFRRNDFCLRPDRTALRLGRQTHRNNRPCYPDGSNYVLNGRKPTLRTQTMPALLPFLRNSTRNGRDLWGRLSWKPAAKA